MKACNRLFVDVMGRLLCQVEKVADVMGMCSQVLRGTKKRSDGRALDFLERIYTVV